MREGSGCELERPGVRGRTALSTASERIFSSAPAYCKRSEAKRTHA